MSEDISREEWLRSSTRNRNSMDARPMPKIDPIVSEIVGKEVSATDPRLIKWALGKSKKNRSETAPTNMLEDRVNRRELRELFHGKQQF